MFSRSVLAFTILTAILLSGCVSVKADPLYKVSTKLPDEPGDLISTAQQEARPTLPGEAGGVTLLYSSRNGLEGQDGGIIPVSGALYRPDGTPPPDGWPILLWSHGTVGVADKCAPSHTGWADNHLNYINHWLTSGYAVLISDYQGLGTVGRHPYMALRPMAYSNLDLLRAVQNFDFDLSGEVFVGGQSQGASAAIATAIFAEDYAPEVQLSGVIATGVPFFTEDSLEAVLQQANPEEWHPNVALSLYALSMAEMVDESFSLKEIVTESAWADVSKVYEQCVFEYFKTTQSAGLSPAKIFQKPYLEPMKTAFRQMIYPNLDINVPVFVGTGAQDTITPAQMQHGFVQSACLSGVEVRSETYDQADHFEALTASIAGAEAFVNAIRSGQKLPSTCPG